MANDLPLYTRNPSDLEGLEELVAVVTVLAPGVAAEGLSVEFIALDRS
jgi:hypothetical protein